MAGSDRTAAALAAAVWRRSTSCDHNGACVEVAGLDERVVAVRDSKDPSGPVLIFGTDAWRAFVTGARLGEFDGPG